MGYRAIISWSVCTLFCGGVACSETGSADQRAVHRALVDTVGPSAPNRQKIEISDDSSFFVEFFEDEENQRTLLELFPKECAVEPSTVDSFLAQARVRVEHKRFDAGELSFVAGEPRDIHMVINLSPVAFTRRATEAVACLRSPWGVVCYAASRASDGTWKPTCRFVMVEY